MSSTFKGTVLVEYWCVDDEHPVMKIRDIEEDDEYKQRLDQMQDKKYHLEAEIGSAICLPDNKKYEICISIGENKWNTGDPMKLQDTYKSCKWNKRFSIDFDNCHQRLQTMPFIFIYLLKDGKPICFWKGECSDFTNPNAKLKWDAFEPDAAMKDTPSYRAGIFSFRLYLH